MIDRPLDEEYTGYQTSPDWLATSPEDFEYLDKLVQGLLGRLNQAHHKVMHFPRKSVPAGFLPDHILNAASQGVPMVFIDWDRIEDKAAFTTTHLRLMPEATRQRLRPIAVVGVAHPKQIMNERAMTLLIDTVDAKCYLCEGPQSTDPTWLGYGDDFFAKFAWASGTA